jgi:hypothetical protein
VDPTRPAGAGGALTIGQLIEKLREKTVRR